MATGYTWPLRDGEDETFTEFAARCACAFNIAYRDAPMVNRMVAPPTTPPGESFQLEAIESSEAELRRVAGLTDAEAAVEAIEARKNAVIRALRADADDEILGARYERILREVARWRPPTEKHEKFREFMVEQLVSSLDHDCNLQVSWADDGSPIVREGDRRFGRYYWDAVEAIPISGARYREYLLKDAGRSIESHTKDLAEARERNEGFAEWWATLAEAIGDPIPDPPRWWRYVVLPGWVTSASDGDRHYVPARKLVRLYGVPWEECIVLDDDDDGYDEDFVRGLTALRPRSSGDYSLPARR